MAYFTGICMLAFGICSGWLTAAQATCIVPKCCPPNQSLDLEKGCQNSSLKFEPAFWNGTEAIRGADSEHLDIFVGDPCQYKKYRLEPEKYSIEEFHILCNGSLLVPFLPSQMYGPHEYCLEAFSSEHDAEEVTLPFLCFPPDPPPPTAIQKIAMAVYPIGLLFSVPFLILTSVVFMGVPELRDTRGRSLSCLCVCLAVGYIALATVLLFGAYFSKTVCVTLGFVIQLSFVSCFLWLNSFCITTWWKLKSNTCRSPLQERKRFLWFSVYVWSLSLTLTASTMFVGSSPVVPATYLKPNFGAQKCLFQNYNGVIPYFYTPIGILLVVNILLLWASLRHVRTAMWQKTKEVSGSAISPYNSCKSVEMFKQCLILFLVMSFNWILELVSYLVGGSVEMWVITDVLNTLLGVIIYFVFIVRVQRVRELARSQLMGWPEWPTHN